MEEGHWAKGFITLLAMLDVIRGYEDGTFRPKAAITREEVAAILINLLKLDPVIKELLESKV